MSTEREELAEDIRDIPVTVLSGPPVDLTGVLAHHLHKLGYRKPRTITTVDELDALPENSAATRNGVVYTKASRGWQIGGAPHYYTAESLLLNENCTLVFDPREATS